VEKAWLWTRAVQAGGRLVIAVDGKAVRGAKGRDGKAPHLVAAQAHGIGAVLGQVAVDEKSNEIPAVRELLKAFADLSGVVLTIDAMHTQHDTAQLILGRGADYVMTVKGNMPTLYRQLRKLPWSRIPSVSSVSKDHGRRARRTIKVALAPAWIGFEGAAQVAQLRRTVVKKGKKTVEVVYLITSDRGASPETLATWVRRHCHIENKLHWGPRRHLPRGQVPGQDRKRTPRHGVAAKFGHQHPAPGRPHEHRRRQPPSRPRPAADPQATPSRMNTTLPGPWVDPRLAKTMLGAWVNIWYPAQDLEPSTLENYRYYIEVHILPQFSEREMRSLTPEEVGDLGEGHPRSRLLPSHRAGCPDTAGGHPERRDPPVYPGQPCYPQAGQGP
jgi:predicted transposase YbfD/YdcC